MLAQTKKYNLKGCTNLRKQQLVTVLSKTKALFMKKDILHKLTKTQLKVFAKEHRIKMNLKKGLKSELNESILSFQDHVRNVETAKEETAKEETAKEEPHA